MTNGDFQWIAGCFCGAVAMTVGILFATWSDPTANQVGYTYQELKEMKDSCEKHLTRAEHCVIVVSYKPENKQDIEQDGK